MERQMQRKGEEVSEISFKILISITFLFADFTTATAVRRSCREAGCGKGGRSAGAEGGRLILLGLFSFTDLTDHEFWGR